MNSLKNIVFYGARDTTNLSSDPRCSLRRNVLVQVSDFPLTRPASSWGVSPILAQSMSHRLFVRAVDIIICLLFLERAAFFGSEFAYDEWER